jgi:hypothetical protein
LKGLVNSTSGKVLTSRINKELINLNYRKEAIQKMDKSFENTFLQK